MKSTMGPRRSGASNETDDASAGMRRSIRRTRRVRGRDPGSDRGSPDSGRSANNACDGHAHGERVAELGISERAEKMCAGSEYMVTLYEDGPFYPGAPNGPSYVATGIRVENGKGQLGLVGGDRASGVNKHVEVGQSVTRDGVGTFTLLDVAPGSGPGGGSAQFCFVPSEGFQVNDSLKK